MDTYSHSRYLFESEWFPSIAPSSVQSQRYKFILLGYSTFFGPTFKDYVYDWIASVIFIVVVYDLQITTYVLHIHSYLDICVCICIPIDSRIPTTVLHAYTIYILRIQWQPIFLQVNRQELFCVAFGIEFGVFSDLSGCYLRCCCFYDSCRCRDFPASYADERYVLKQFIQCWQPIRSRSQL